MKGIRAGKTIEYICKEDRELPKEDQTVWELKLLGAKEQAKLRDDLYEISGMGEGRTERFKTGSTALKALELGLKGWRNFRYDDGEPVPFSVENFDCIPPETRDELSNIVRGIKEGQV